MTAIRLENLSFIYPHGKVAALSGVTLGIPEGSFFALLGPNGAGKTTLLRLLCGRFATFDGVLEIAANLRGKNGFLTPQKYGVLLENPGVYPKLSIEEYVNYFAGFYGISNAHDRIAELSKVLELPDSTTRLSALSLGNRQKVQLLRAMVHRPRLLILDEPVANLDPNARESVWSLISKWRREEGGTAIVCSHILSEMENEATDFAIIDHGSVLKQGRVSDFESRQNSIQLELPEGVSMDQVSAALQNAGLARVQIKPSKSALSELYRNTVQ